jgi:anti-sigma regulatory factor (Ser/Thr protein kinase)
MHQELVLLGAAPDVAFEAMKWTESACARAGIGSQRAQRAATAVIEAVNNSIEHGYRMRSGSVSIALEGYADRVEISITDAGTGLPPAPVIRCPEPAAARGRGSWIMGQSCDRVRHEFPNGEQRVVLVLLRSPEPIQPAGDPS